MEEATITFDATYQGHGSQICPTTGVSVINLEQCCICSVFYEQPQRPIPQTDLNRMICKVLDVLPDFSFFREYLSICVNCANLLRKFDRLRVELEFVKTQLVTYVIESLTQMRDGGTGQLDVIKDQILNRWTNAGSKKNSNKKGFTAASVGGGDKLDLSWAAHNNLMRNATEVDPVPNWSGPADVSNSVIVRTEEARISASPIPSPPHYDDDHFGGGGEDDMITDNVEGDGNVPETDKHDAQQADGASPKKKRKKGSKTKRKDGSPRKRKNPSPAKPQRIGGVVYPLICTICGRVFSKQTTYNGHISVCETDDSWIDKECTICREELGNQILFETWTDFKNHVDANHVTVPKLEKCQFCGLNLLPFGCKYHKCKGFSKQIDENPIFKCDVCDRAYHSRANLTDHVRRSHKDQKYECEICTKTYGSPMLLRLHVERHKRTVSKFKCSYCGICLASSYSLKHHTRAYHTKETPYQCKICERKFTSYTVYKHHQMVHSNKKPEICHLCGRGFKLKGTLRRHVVRHQLKETTHTKKCPLCPKGMFRKIWVLKKHMEAEHPGTPEMEEVFEKYKDIDDAPRDGKRRRIAPGKGRKYTIASKKIGTSKEDEDSESEEESGDEDSDEDSEGGEEESTNTGDAAAQSKSDETPSKANNEPETGGDDSVKIETEETNSTDNVVDNDSVAETPATEKDNNVQEVSPPETRKSSRIKKPTTRKLVILLSKSDSPCKQSSSTPKKSGPSK